MFHTMPLLYGAHKFGSVGASIGMGKGGPQGRPTKVVKGSDGSNSSFPVASGKAGYGFVGTKRSRVEDSELRAFEAKSTMFLDDASKLLGLITTKEIHSAGVFVNGNPMLSMAMFEAIGRASRKAKLGEESNARLAQELKKRDELIESLKAEGRGAIAAVTQDRNRLVTENSALVSKNEALDVSKTLLGWRSNEDKAISRKELSNARGEIARLQAMLATVPAPGTGANSTQCSGVPPPTHATPAPTVQVPPHVEATGRWASTISTMISVPVQMDVLWQQLATSDMDAANNVVAEIQAKVLEFSSKTLPEDQRQRVDAFVKAGPDGWAPPTTIPPSLPQVYVDPSTVSASSLSTQAPATSALPALPAIPTPFVPPAPPCASVVPAPVAPPALPAFPAPPAPPAPLVPSTVPATYTLPAPPALSAPLCVPTHPAPPARYTVPAPPAPSAPLSVPTHPTNPARYTVSTPAPIPPSTSQQSGYVGQGVTDDKDRPTGAKARRRIR